MNSDNPTFVITSLVLIGVEEHLFTSFLSSPASMRTFYASDSEKRAQVKRDANLALGLSIAASAFAWWGIKDVRAFLVGVAAAGGFYLLLLKRGGII